MSNRTLRCERLRRDLRLVVLMIVAALSWGCGDPEPVGGLVVEPATVELCSPCTTRIELHWQPLRPLPGLRGKPRVFLHLLDEAGTLVRTFDHPYPARWQAAQPMSYPVALLQSALGEQLAPGRYRLTAGLHDSGTSQRWPLQVRGDEIRTMEYGVAEVIVPAQPPRLAVDFQGEWLPLEPGTDLQVLGRRWVAGPATIKLSAMTGPGELELTGGLPEWAAELPEAEVSVTASCEVEPAAFSGMGLLTIKLGIKSTDGCLISLQPNFEQDEQVGGPGLLVLERLTWRPSAPR